MKIEPQTLEIRADSKSLILVYLGITISLFFYITYDAGVSFGLSPATSPFVLWFMLIVVGYSILHLARLYWFNPIVIRMSREGLFVPKISQSPIPWSAIADLHHRKGGEGEKGNSILVIILKKEGDDQFLLEKFTSKWNPFSRWANSAKFEVALDFCAMPHVQILEHLHEWLQFQSVQKSP